jgi:hypothetical protein
VQDLSKGQKHTSKEDNEIFLYYNVHSNFLRHILFHTSLPHEHENKIVGNIIENPQQLLTFGT